MTNESFCIKETTQFMFWTIISQPRELKVLGLPRRINGIVDFLTVSEGSEEKWGEEEGDEEV